MLNTLNFNTTNFFAMRFLLLLSFLLGTFASAFASISLPSILGSNMVMPQQTKLRLWGWGSPSEKINIVTSWDDRTDSVVTTRDGKWELWVNTPKASGPYHISFKGGNEIKLDNVMIGAVWLCSGQSNMEWNYYNKVDGMDAELKKGVQPEIRFFQVARKTAVHPQEDIPGTWVVCDSNSLKTFSAVGYFFGQKLKDSLHMPVGLINASWGGTPAEVWMPAQTVLGNETWKAEAETHNKTAWWTVTPGFAYNAMIAPLTPFAIDGVIWYQGESNVGLAKSYGDLFGALIQSWRKEWNKELPFYFVQIAPFTYGQSLNAALLREQQAKVAATLPKTGMVVVSDLVKDTTDIHPTNKKDVGYRLASLALHETYKIPQAGHRSKVLASVAKKGDKMVLQFGGNEGQVMIRGKEPVALFIAGADGNFLPAKAKVIGSGLEVWHPKIKDPQSVRYQFTSTGIGNLTDIYGLPIAPFRTDAINP